MTPDFVRHSLTLVMDVPAALAADTQRMEDVLNAAVSRITELLDSDPRLRALLSSHGVELGWEAGSWE